MLPQLQQWRLASEARLSRWNRRSGPNLDTGEYFATDPTDVDRNCGLWRYKLTIKEHCKLFQPGPVALVQGHALQTREGIMTQDIAEKLV